MLYERNRWVTAQERVGEIQMEEVCLLWMSSFIQAKLLLKEKTEEEKGYVCERKRSCQLQGLTPSCLFFSMPADGSLRSGLSTDWIPRGWMRCENKLVFLVLSHFIEAYSVLFGTGVQAHPYGIFCGVLGKRSCGYTEKPAWNMAPPFRFMRPDNHLAALCLHACNFFSYVNGQFFLGGGDGGIICSLILRYN